MFAQRRSRRTTLPARGCRALSSYLPLPATRGEEGKGPLWLLRQCLLGLLLLAGSPLAFAADPPKRVASVNLCLDEIVQRIAAPGQLAAVSFVAHDPSLSSIAAEVASLPGLDLRGEAVLALQPDLVLAHDYAGTTTKALLRRQGVPILELPMALDIEAAADQAIAIGDALGRGAQGRALAEDMRREAARLHASLPGGDDATRPLAALWQPNGGTEGRGTLADDLLRRAGLRNLASELGIAGFGVLPIETLILHKPELVIVDGSGRTPGSLAETLQAHPALRATGLAARFVDVPRRMLVCAGPQSLQALALLVEARKALKPGGAPATPR